MSVAVPSRFACLKIEDDDNNNRPISQTNRKKLTNNSNNNNNTSKTTMAKKINTNKKTVTNQKQSNDNRQTNTNVKKQKKKQNDKQWEEWKKKDNELVNDNFEQDLQYAIIQSKLQYEVDIKNKITDETTSTTETDKHTNNKKKKNKPMNLAEFLETDTDTQINQHSPINTVINGDHQQDNHEDFFDKMMEVAKREVIKGKLEEERKERDINFEEMITRTQFEEKLKFEQQRNIELQKQLDEAHAEIVAVKERNKIFCTILAQGEMKDKAGILLELERLNNVKDELTEEVARLHELLEQERSKSASLLDSHNTATKHKDNKNKK